MPLWPLRPMFWGNFLPHRSHTYLFLSAFFDTSRGWNFLTWRRRFELLTNLATHPATWHLYFSKNNERTLRYQIICSGIWKCLPPSLTPWLIIISTSNGFRDMTRRSCFLRTLFAVWLLENRSEKYQNFTSIIYLFFTKIVLEPRQPPLKQHGSWRFHAWSSISVFWFNACCLDSARRYELTVIIYGLSSRNIWNLDPKITICFSFHWSRSRSRHTGKFVALPGSLYRLWRKNNY